jgi:membrane-associated phospholipid phosphatase
MLPRTKHSGWLVTLAAAAAVSGCADTPTRLVQPQAANLDAVKFWEVTASTRWNERANVTLALRQPANGQAAASRVLTYLSIAQYRAVLAAEAGKEGRVHPSVSAAVGAASVAVLSSFFPGDAGTFESQLDADLAAPGWPGAKNQDAASGEAIGRAVGATVVAQAATDNYLVVLPGSPPIGPGVWVQNGPIVRSLLGVRPFFLTSPSQIRAAPPPAYGSPEFNAALAEVFTYTNPPKPELLAIAQRWAAGFTISANNRVANELIRQHHRTEREAARILAYTNAATFDSQIACWDSKLFYWVIRPVQANPQIAVSVPMPNHPSYPSGHSCVTGGFMATLMEFFPSERGQLQALIEEAGMSRVYGGIHYRFDVEAGQEIGRRAAALALAGSLE